MTPAALPSPCLRKYQSGRRVHQRPVRRTPGEVRGQIPEPTPLDDAINISLSGENEIYLPSSTVTGTVYLNGSRTVRWVFRQPHEPRRRCTAVRLEPTFTVVRLTKTR
jgi:hypothetical protein